MSWLWPVIFGLPRRNLSLGSPRLNGGWFLDLAELSVTQTGRKRHSQRAAFGLCFATEDQKRGMTAFVEKRTAVFKGK